MIQVHGHRGARAVLPENTIAAFEYAIGVGVQAIELDVVVSRDDVIVVSHDPYLKSGTYIRTLTAKESGLPTLSEVFGLAGRGDFLFNVEAKVSEHTPFEFRRTGARPDRRARREIAGHLPIVRLCGAASHEPPCAGDHCWRLCGKATRGALSRSRRTRGLRSLRRCIRWSPKNRFGKAHDAGLRVIPWTANTPDDWAALIAAGVDGIITDDPAALIAYLKSISEVRSLVGRVP